VAGLQQSVEPSVNAIALALGPLTDPLRELGCTGWGQGLVVGGQSLHGHSTAQHKTCVFAGTVQRKQNKPVGAQHNTHNPDGHST
jgi:hypothetical protein